LDLSERGQIRPPDQTLQSPVGVVINQWGLNPPAPPTNQTLLEPPSPPNPRVSKENSNYKPINGRLAEHFGFRVNSDGNVDNVEAVRCVHCHKLS